jgi:hypothetical protein
MTAHELSQPQLNFPVRIPPPMRSFGDARNSSVIRAGEGHKRVIGRPGVLLVLAQGRSGLLGVLELLPIAQGG